MKMHTTRPKSGIARKIWDSLTNYGFQLKEIHYNANCWQKPGTSENGWGTWAFTAYNEMIGNEIKSAWCGWDKDANTAYIELMQAPYIKYFIPYILMVK